MTQDPIPVEFVPTHLPALERNQARHSLILSAFEAPDSFTGWSLGRPGECAVRSQRSLILGDLTEPQCHRLADITVGVCYTGVIGPDDTVLWFTDEAQTLNLDFIEVEEHLIWSLRERPKYPGCPGHARLVEQHDLNLMLDWLPLFQQESNPHDPIPSPDEIREIVRDGRITLWIDQERVVSMAAITRRLKHSASITGVYTPPEHRGHGYAGAATAAIVDRIYSEGREMASLYTDVANIASGRCYEKIGFIPVCRSRYWVRA